MDRRIKMEAIIELFHDGLIDVDKVFEIAREMYEDAAAIIGFKDEMLSAVYEVQQTAVGRLELLIEGKDGGQT